MMQIRSKVEMCITKIFDTKKSLIKDLLNYHIAQKFDREKL